MPRLGTHPLDACLRGGAVPAGAVPLAHAGDYVEVGAIGIAFAVFLALVVRERARARRAAGADPERTREEPPPAADGPQEPPALGR